MTFFANHVRCLVIVCLIHVELILWVTQSQFQFHIKNTWCYTYLVPILLIVLSILCFHVCRCFGVFLRPATTKQNQIYDITIIMPFTSLFSVGVLCSLRSSCHQQPNWLLWLRRWLPFAVFLLWMVARLPSALARALSFSNRHFTNRISTIYATLKFVTV